MTTAQKTAKAKFKQAIEYRKKTGVSLKEAFAHIYGKKKIGLVAKKTVKKKKAKLTTEDKKDKSSFSAMARKHKKARVGALKLKPNEMRLGLLSSKIGKTVKKKAAKKKAVSSKHIDTKSHNVNIKIMSGIGAIDSYKKVMDQIHGFDIMINYVKTQIRHKLVDPKDLPLVKKELKRSLALRKEFLTHAKELKKHI